MARSTKANILIVDDEESILETLTGILEDEGYQVITASSGESAVMKFSETSPDIVLLDVWMPGMDGIETLKRLREKNKNICVIMISGHSNIDTAVHAIKHGAYDFLEKPLSLDKVLILISRALEKQRLENENIALRQSISQQWEIVGENHKIIELRDKITKAAISRGRVLIFGESGSGKELVARALHDESTRKNRSFIEVNCAAIPQELIESELFGHEKGSFTGAFESKKGKFELAHEGTLFLDEIGDMSLVTQAKVLRIIETQEFQRVGGSKKIKVDVRIIAATNKDLDEEIQKGNFREDLYFRLNVIPIYVPSLRERKSDIPLLVEYFLKNLAGQYGQKKRRVSRATLRALMEYDWPGNVRELKNAIERFVIMNPDEVIDIKEVQPLRAIKSDYISFKTLRDAREQFEKNFILKKLQENNWNVSRTAEELEIERSNLHRKIKSLGIETS
ncbi:MAG TPA: sigma-54-dependent Fis family transcriptional regulator [Nitrospirae bacterium]|nr:transcriptional regulatory protein ZraR [bacterium BMS3Abin06]HDH11130.1 sigma-54-dependent Fis family transcriptional regulator [Nitrospirota bacterium]HDZ02531.1 sigma-54-dependent Fis family transcriptional regulator [Nitrospirota bacterium]